MGYGLWGAIPCPLRQWTQQCMGFQRLWVMASMGYEGADCSHVAATNNHSQTKFCKSPIKGNNSTYLCKTL